VYPRDEEPPTAVLPSESTTVRFRASRPGLRRLLGLRATVVATIICGVALIAGTGLALSSLIDVGDNTAQPAAPSSRSIPPSRAPSPSPSPNPSDDQAARQAWGRQYGQDRAAMPDLPDVASATPQQQAAASDLLARTQSSTAAFTDTAKALAAGFDLQAALSRAEQVRPQLLQRLQRIDAGQAKGAPPMLRVTNRANTQSGNVLDPTAPQMLLYQYQGHNVWRLIGAGFLANRSYPQPPPDPGGPITRWSYDNKHPATLRMDMFFVAGNDLARAYALSPPAEAAPPAH
jgi:hypothetical protein